MTSIPRFDVLGGSGANFRNVRTVSPVGLRAQEQLANDTARALEGQAQQFAIIQENADRNVAAQRDIDLDLKAQEIRERNRLNPNGFLEGMENYINATAEEVPESVRDEFLLRARQKTAAAFIQERKKFVAHELELSRRESAAFLEIQEDRLINYGAPDNDVEMTLLEQDQQIYDIFVGAEIESGNLTRSEAELRRIELNDKMQSSYLLDKMQSTDRPLDYLVQAVNGQIDDPIIKDMSPAALQQAFSQGQQLFSALQQLEQRDERILGELKTAQETIHVGNIYDNPTDPSAQDSIDKLRRLATSPAELKKVQDLREFVANAESAKYTKSDPQITFETEKEFARGELTEERLNELHGNGLSTLDFNGYRKRLEGQRDSLVTSPTFKLVQERLDQEFPGPKKLDSTTLLMSMFSKNPIPGVSNDPKEIARLEMNEKVKTQMLLDLKSRVLDTKEIATEGALLDAANAAIVKARQEIAQGVEPQQRSRPVVLTRPKAAAMENPTAVELSKKYSGNIQQVIVDMDTGKLDPQTAREVYNILKEEEDAKERN